MSDQPISEKSVLKGRLVLDLASLITGPYCASILGDLGADVIKVEHPIGGDAIRHLGFIHRDESSLFLSINRNKKGITLDLGKAAGRAILDRLLSRADVLIENFRPDIKSKYRLSYEDVCRANPKIIHLSVTAFGESGPYSLKPGTDNVFQGLSGIMTVSGEQGQGPVRVGVPVADMTAALFSAIGVMSALLHRQRTGKGQEIRINLLDATMCLQTTMIGEYFLSGEMPEQCGNDSPFAYPAGVFETLDGHICLSVFTEKFWRGLCLATNNEDLLADGRFNSSGVRMKNKEELKRILTDVFRKKKTSEWMNILEKRDVPCGPVHDYKSLFMDPQVQHNRMVRELPHSRLETVRTLGNPIRFDETPVTETRGAPVLSEDTDAVLIEFGYHPDEIEAFRKEKII